MKKVSLLVILAAMMLVAFVGCGQATPSASAESSAPAVSESASEPAEVSSEAPSEEVSAEPVVLNVVGSTSVGSVCMR